MYGRATSILVFSCCFAFRFGYEASAQQKSWSTTQDFGQGEFINLNAGTVADQLQINTWSDTKASDPAVLPYLWVACSARSTVVRIATSTHDPLTQQSVSVGQILGRYFTAPSGCRATGVDNSGPSRTTVDFDGGVWVGKRSQPASRVVPLAIAWRFSLGPGRFSLTRIDTSR